MNLNMKWVITVMPKVLSMSIILVFTCPTVIYHFLIFNSPKYSDNLNPHHTSSKIRTLSGYLRVSRADSEGVLEVRPNPFFSQNFIFMGNFV